MLEVICPRPAARHHSTAAGGGDPSWQVTGQLVSNRAWPELAEGEKNLGERRAPGLGWTAQRRPDRLSGPPMRDVWGSGPSGSRGLVTGVPTLRGGAPPPPWLMKYQNKKDHEDRQHSHFTDEKPETKEDVQLP